MGRAAKNIDLGGIPPLPIVEQALAEKSLNHFIRQSWHVVEPKTPFVSGWHLDAICEHLEAVIRGDITRLLINIPPRHMKSLAVAVFGPAWSWIDSPHLRWLFASYAESLSKRDSLKTRRLTQSPWFQERWSDRFELTSDQNEKLRFENSRSGYRLATSVGGLGTGEGGDIIAVDDPHNTLGAESQAKREAALVWWDETMSTRLNDPKTGRIIIVMQRLHERDLAGHVLAQGGYEHLCLPARFEPKHPTLSQTSLGFCDPRTAAGQPLWAEKYGEAELADLEKRLGPYGVAGQLQQRPVPRGGGLFNVRKFQVVQSAPSHVTRWVRYWDKAGTADGGKRTAGVLIGQTGSGHFVVADVVKGQWSAGKREKVIKETADRDGRDVEVGIEQEPGSGGKESAENTIRNLAGFRVFADRPTGDKETRAEPYASQVEGENVFLLLGDWNEDFIEEHKSFPRGQFADQVDAAAGAFNRLNKPRKVAGAW